MTSILLTTDEAMKNRADAVLHHTMPTCRLCGYPHVESIPGCRYCEKRYTPDDESDAVTCCPPV